ncbi:MAG: YggT family protein [Cyanobacteria bacterium P01_F01_bin.42]
MEYGSLQSASSIIGDGIVQFINIYLILLLIRVLLTWFPSVDWGRPPFSILSQLTDPYLNLFRSLIPSIGGIDLSPLLAFFALQIVAGLLGGLL